MTLREIKACLTKIEYKNMDITIVGNQYVSHKYAKDMEASFHRLRLTRRVVDSYYPSKMATISKEYTLNMFQYEEYWDEERFVRFIFEQVLEFEHHEAGEFFKYKNERPFDPHNRMGKIIK